MKLFDALGRIGTYACIATSLALVAVVGTLWVRGSLDEHRCQMILAILYGQDLVPADRADPPTVPTSQVSYEEVLQQRTLQTLDADLRQAAADNALLDLNSLAAGLQREKRRIVALRDSLETRLRTLQQDVDNAALRDVATLLESISPAAAKQQLVHLLDQGEIDQVVGIIQQMAPDKQRKLLAEFESSADASHLAEILRVVGQGSKQGRLIRDVRDSIQTPGLESPEK